jgi:hypothetical protein
MKIFSLCLTLAALLLAPPSGAAEPVTTPIFRAHIPKNTSSNVTILQAETKRIVMIGGIGPPMLRDFKNAIAATPGLDTLVIDSYGGVVASALEMAALIRQHHLRLVVDGRCLSACASYLFAAADVKTVLPGSLVAIHGLVITYPEGKTVKVATASQATDLFKSAMYAENRALYERDLKNQDAFYQELGIKPEPYAVFARYMAHRRQVLGTDTISAAQRAGGCPAVQMWALDKAQLEAMGVRGIADFWYPSSLAQKLALARELGLPADFFYYGPAAGLERLCTQPRTWGERLQQWLDETSARLGDAIGLKR